MAFNSLEFVIFFCLFFFLYWFVFNRNVRVQNLLLLTGSYVFFAWWDWRFLSLLIGSSLINYLLGIYIHKTENEKRQRFLIFLGLLQGLGGLLFFKYYNFFVSSLADLLSVFNIKVNISLLNLVLPLGISFYTFRAISYLIDIKNEIIKPTKDWVVFFTYLAFFPSLLAGPIDRAKTFIPQLENKRRFEYTQFSNGIYQILWGLFKKVVIADNCATVTSQIFNNYPTEPASSLLVGAFLYSIQIYADFSGYSEMAIGVSRLLGFNLIRNFNYPFFAQNIAEFWQRWHISLTSWMTDYVYTPLSFVLRRKGKIGMILAIVINFVIVGLWHGANWTFILFGFVQGCFFIPLIIRGTLNKRKKIAENKLLPGFREFLNMAGTFTLIMFSNIIFMASSVSQAFGYFKHLFSFSIFSWPAFISKAGTVTIIVFCLITLLIEWLQRNKEHALQFVPATSKYKIYLRAGFIWIIVWAIVLWGAFGNKTFIYVKF
jgi:alginate O-acetyltransferase complex protein AlgI